MELNNVLFIVNPVAGRKTAKKALPEIMEIFASNGIGTEVELTSQRFDAEKLAAEADSSFSAVVCVGGDGTLNEVISGIAKTDNSVPVGYIPAGTTNDFAKTLGISNDTAQAAQDIINGEPRAIDIGQFGSRYFTYIASFGAFTEISYSTPQQIKNVLGHSAYMLGNIKSLFNLKAFPMTITADGEKHEGDFMFGAVCNSTSIAGLFNLDPNEVDMADGMFEVIAAKEAKDPATLIKRITDFKNMKYPSDTIHFFKAKEITFSSETELDWSLDGEYAHGENNVTIRNLNQKINLILNTKKMP